MTVGFLFWLLMILWLLFGGWFAFRPNGDRYTFGWSLLVFLLFLLLGIRVFGWPIKG